MCPETLTVSNKNKAWHQLIQANHLYDLPKAVQIEHAISDSGATGHFLVKNAPVTNKKIVRSPISITLPNGKTIKSTHTCNLDISWLPHTMTEAHIVPGLTHSSLISTQNFCDAGCKVVFDIHKCRVYFKQKLVLTGKCVPSNEQCGGLWRLPINPTAPASVTNTIAKQHLYATKRQEQVHHAVNNVHTLPYLQNQVRYMHQTFFSQPKHILIKAIANDQLKVSSSCKLISCVNT